MIRFKKSIIFALILFFLSSFCMSHASYAKDKPEDLAVTITSDKESYTSAEIAQTTIVVTNQSQQTLSDVEVSCLLPEGLQLKEGTTEKATIETLEAGKSLTLTVDVQKVLGKTLQSTPQTGDGTDFQTMLLVALVAFATSVYFVLRNKKLNLKNLFSIVVCALLLTGVGIIGNQFITRASEGDLVSFQKSKEIVVDESTYDIVFEIKYVKNVLTDEEKTDDENTASSEFDLVDFVVEVESGREPVILHFSDTQIIDSSQCRDESTSFIPSTQNYWAPDKLDARLYDSLTETIEETNPDLILITGDLVYGQYDDKGTMLQSLIEKMDSFGIPWAPVFGNHDNESAKGVAWQCRQLENAENCLFKRGTVTGNGNYTVGIKQNGILTRVFFMMDSNGCLRSAGFGKDQMDWSVGVAEAIQEFSPNTKFSYAFHIQLYAFKDAYAKYGFTNSGTQSRPINIDKADNKAETDFGYLGRDLKGAWDVNYEVYNQIKAVGADSIFVGHEHCNSASVVYEGIRFQYGQKMGTYDRCNFVKDDGSIYEGIVKQDTPLSGGTVMKMSETNGNFVEAYIYYSGDAQAKLNTNR